MPRHHRDAVARWWRTGLFAFCLALGMARANAQQPVHSPVKVVYVIPSSHWDLGFLRPPEAEMDVIKPHIDAVIRACAQDPQFRWTIESVWQLQAWLDRTHDPALIDRLAALLRSGQIELSAADGSMHTEFMGSEELNRLVYAAKAAELRFGIHAGVAMMNDVPGFSERLPQVLARSGVRYLITGSNTNFGGGTSLAPGKMPIDWRSPDGSEVLMWETKGKDGGYTEALADYYIDPDARDPYSHEVFYPKQWQGLPKLEIMQRGIDKLVSEYAAAGYPHSVAALLYMHDGIGPEYELNGLIPNVRAWNAAGRSPRLVIATPAAFFAAMEHESNFPTYTGDWSGLWSAVKLNSPAMSGDARWLQDRLPQAETLWALIAQLHPGASYPAAEIASDYRKLFLYDEHNGSGQGGWPKLLTRAEVMESNQEYAGYLQSARRSVEQLLDEGAKLLAAEHRPSTGQRLVMVYNPHSWPFTGMSRLSQPGAYTVEDASSGQQMKVQRDEVGVTYFEVQNVPPLGYRTYIVQPLSGNPPANDTAAEPTLASPYFEVQLDAKGGAITRIIDRRTHRSILDAARGDYAARLVRSPEGQPVIVNAAKFHHERGPLFERVRIKRPDAYWPETVITLPHDEPRIDISETLDRAKMPFVAYHEQGARYSFEFSLAAAKGARRLVSNGDELYGFPEDLLPGARNDAVVPRHTLVWSSGRGSQSYQLMLTQKQTFFDALPPHACRAESISCSDVRVEAMIKSDQAETRDQGVVSFASYEPGYPSLYTYDFSLTGVHSEPDPVAAQQFEAGDALISVLLPDGRRPSRWSRSLFSISEPNVIVEDLKPSLDGKSGDLMLRLHEIAGRDTTVSVASAVPIAQVVETTTTEDKQLTKGLPARAIHVAAHQTLTLRLTTYVPGGKR
jgi:hypothetical protein